MHEQKRVARIAGFLYLVVVISGMFSLAYVPKQLVVAGNPAITFENIRDHTRLFRAGIYSSVICYLAFSMLPLVLYRLLNAVSKPWAVAMEALALLSVPMSLLNLQYKYTVLNLVSTQPDSKNAGMEVLQNAVMFSLRQYNNGVFLATVFWGLWLFPFGVLVYRSGFLPKALGILLMMGCIAYLINFTGGTLFENYSSVEIGNYISYIPAIAEISICLWLMIVGIKMKPHEN